MKQEQELTHCSMATSLLVWVHTPPPPWQRLTKRSEGKGSEGELQKLLQGHVLVQKLLHGVVARKHCRWRGLPT